MKDFLAFTFIGLVVMVTGDAFDIITIIKGLF